VADHVTNIAKGRLAYYGGLPDANSAFIAVLFRDAVQADGTLNDHTTLSTWLASNSEANFTNYARKVLTGVSVSIDNATDRVRIIATTPLVWNNAGLSGTNNSLSKILFCYRPSSTPTDAQIIPISHHDLSATTNGTNLQINLNASGVAEAIGVTG
jgi:hypothetical protein